MDESHGVGAAHPRYEAHQAEIFLDRILKNHAVATAHAKEIGSDSGEVAQKRPDFRTAVTTPETEIPCAHRSENILIVGLGLPAGRFLGSIAARHIAETFHIPLQK